MQKNDYYKIAFFSFLLVIIAGGVMYFLTKKDASQIQDNDFHLRQDFNSEEEISVTIEKEKISDGAVKNYLVC